MSNNTLQVYRGDSKTYDITFKDSSGDAIDITDYTIFFTVKEYETDTDADAKISKTITDHSDPTNGTTQISLSTDNTNLAIKTYYYDIQIKDGSGNIITVVKDTFEILQDITTRTT